MQVSEEKRAKGTFRSRLEQVGNWPSFVVMAVVAITYLLTAFHDARVFPLWMDEVLTVWLVRMPTIRDIYHGLALGAQYAPPGHPVLLHLLAKVTNDHYVTLRGASILGGFVTA